MRTHIQVLKENQHSSHGRQAILLITNGTALCLVLAGAGFDQDINPAHLICAHVQHTKRAVPAHCQQALGGGLHAHVSHIVSVFLEAGHRICLPYVPQLHTPAVVTCGGGEGGRC